jgi:hypothetical protein
MAKYPELAGMPKNEAAMNALIRAAIIVWEDLEEGMLDHLLLSMPRRLQAVIDAGGWYTKY